MASSGAAIGTLSRMAGQGPVVIVGTCDAARVPEVSRGWGVRVLVDAGAIEVCVYASSSRTLANLAEHDYAAVTVTSPSTYHSIQIKGRALVVPLDADDMTHVAAHQQAFVDEVASLGLPKEMSPRMFEDEARRSPAMMKIRVSVEESFDQTPGPSAGARL